jgi:hypothetical protein
MKRHDIMTLPGAERAYVEEQKIAGYLLSFSSEDGQHKAAFFERFGFMVDDWRALADALVQHASHGLVSAVEANEPFGLIYVVEGPLRTPTGRRPDVRSVWEVREHGAAPRLITAYPVG